MSDTFDHEATAWDSRDWDWDGEDAAVRCKYCGTAELHWEETNNGWRLYTDELVAHQCGFSASTRAAFRRATQQGAL